MKIIALVIDDDDDFSVTVHRDRRSMIDMAHKQLTDSQDRADFDRQIERGSTHFTIGGNALINITEHNI